MEPIIGRVAADIYDELSPLTYAEVEHEYALMKFCEALGMQIEDINTYVRTDDGGEPGWSMIVDIDRAPSIGLAWLAQFVGVEIQAGLSDTAQRDWIRSTANWKRGSTAAMKGAAAPTLTGTQTVVFRERYDQDNPGVDAPYHVTVITYTAETPDPVATLANIIEQKPAGLILHYQVNPGQDYQSLRTNYLDYNAVRTAYGTYDGVRLDEPGT